MRIELVNLGPDIKPQNINLGLSLSSKEINAFICLLKRYKDIFSWNYQDLKTYDASIIQHIMPMVPDVKPIQQKCRKIHLKLET